MEVELSPGRQQQLPGLGTGVVLPAAPSSSPFGACLLKTERPAVSAATPMTASNARSGRSLPVRKTPGAAAITAELPIAWLRLHSLIERMWASLPPIRGACSHRHLGQQRQGADHAYRLWLGHDAGGSRPSSRSKHKHAEDTHGHALGVGGQCAPGQCHAKHDQCVGAVDRCRRVSNQRARRSRRGRASPQE